MRSRSSRLALRGPGLLLLSTALLVCTLGDLLLPDPNPTLRFGAWLLATLVVGAIAWLVSGLAEPVPLDLRVIDAAIIGLALVALAVLSLGSVGILGWDALAIVTAIAGLVFGIIRRPTSAATHSDEHGVIRIGLLSSLAIGLSAFAVIQALLGRVFRPPIGDALSYHLPFAVEWLQRGSLAMPIPAAGDPSPPFYPLNAAAWTYWWIAPFDSEILARFVQLPFLLLLGVAVYRLACDLRLARLAALMAVALAISVPAVARSAAVPENDLMLTAVLVVALVYLLRLGRECSTWRAVLAATAIGLAIGTKVIALGLCALLGVVWIALVLRERRQSSVGGLVRVYAAGIVFVVALGSYSYVRNTIMMGNPLYPAGYELPGGFVLDGLYFPTWEWRQAHAFFPFDWQAFLNGSRRDFGWTVTVWALPGVLLAAVVSLAGLLRRAPGVLWGFMLLLWVAASLAIFWFVIPYHFSRFLFPTIVVAIVAGFWGLDTVTRWTKLRILHTWYPALALPLVLANLVEIPLNQEIRERPIYWLAFVAVVGGCAASLLAIQRSTSRQALYATRVAVVGVLALALVLWPIYRAEYLDRRIIEWRGQILGYSQAPDGWEWLDEQTREGDHVIAVAGTNEIFPFYGPELANRILTIWHSGAVAGYDWSIPYSEPGQPDQETWFRTVAANGVDYLIVTENVSFGGWPVERAWLQDSPERFQLAYRNAAMEIWKVEDSGARAARYTPRQGRITQFDWQVH